MKHDLWLCTPRHSTRSRGSNGSLSQQADNLSEWSSSDVEYGLKVLNEPWWLFIRWNGIDMSRLGSESTWKIASTRLHAASPTAVYRGPLLIYTLLCPQKPWSSLAVIRGPWGGGLVRLHFHIRWTNVWVTIQGLQSGLLLKYKVLGSIEDLEVM